MEAAQEMLAGYPANCPPTILLLAFDEGLAVPFASRLNQAIAPTVKLAADGEPLAEGTVYLAADPTRHVVVDRWPGGAIRLVERDAVNGCRPSADVLFGALARTGAAKAAGVILSGGGVDGAAGLAAMRAAGGLALVQSQETALVDQTIKAAVDKGVTASLAPGELAAAALASR